MKYGKKVLCSLFVAILVLGMAGCFGKKKTKDPKPDPKPTPVVVDPTPVAPESTKFYQFNCTIDMQKTASVMVDTLGWEYKGIVTLATQGRAAVYGFNLPSYYPPQHNIVDSNGNQDFVWQNCPGRSPYTFDAPGLKRYADHICDLGYNRFNKDRAKYLSCLSRGK